MGMDCRMVSNMVLVYKTSSRPQRTVSQYISTYQSYNPAKFAQVTMKSTIIAVLLSAVTLASAWLS